MPFLCHFHTYSDLYSHFTFTFPSSSPPIRSLLCFCQISKEAAVERKKAGRKRLDLALSQTVFIHKGAFGHSLVRMAKMPTEEDWMRPLTGSEMTSKVCKRSWEV